MARLICASDNFVFVVQGDTNLCVLDRDGKIVQNKDFESKILAITADSTRLAVAVQQKIYYVFNVTKETGELTQIGKILGIREAEGLIFAQYNDKDALLLNDGGDVNMIDLSNPSILNSTDKIKPVVLMGHIATCTCFGLSPDCTQLATADRDGRIRISKYPQAYDIIGFGFFHEEFVTSLAYLPSGELVSGDGDGKIAKWSPTAELVVSKQLFESEKIVRSIVPFGDKIVVTAEYVSKAYVLDYELNVVNTIELPADPICGTAVGETAYIGCNGALIDINGKPIEGFNQKTEGYTLAKRRVINKKIIKAGDKTSDTYAMWRDPEQAPSKLDE